VQFHGNKDDDKIIWRFWKNVFEKKPLAASPKSKNDFRLYHTLLRGIVAEHGTGPTRVRNVLRSAVGKQASQIDYFNGLEP
jgi:hypothetical protein